MKENPHCHWCGKEVRYYVIPIYEKTPHDFATIDHIYTKLEFDKRLAAAKANDPNRHVLACASCNSSRNHDQVRSYNKNAWRIRQELGKQRAKLHSKQPRPQIFRGLENIDA